MKRLSLLLITLLTILTSSIVLVAFSPPLDDLMPSGFGLIPLEGNDIKVEKIDILFDGNDSRIASDSNYEVMATTNYLMRYNSDSKTVKMGLPYFTEDDIGDQISQINFSINNKKIEPNILIGMHTSVYSMDKLDYKDITSNLVSEDFSFEESVNGKLYSIPASTNDVTVTVECSLDSKIIYSGFQYIKLDKSVNDRIKGTIEKQDDTPAYFYDATGEATIDINIGSFTITEMSNSEYINYVIGTPYHKYKYISYALGFLELENGVNHFDYLLEKSHRMIILEYDVPVIGNNEPNQISVSYILYPSTLYNYRPYLYQYNYIHFHDEWQYYSNKYLYDVDVRIKPKADIKYLIDPKLAFTANDSSYELEVREIGFKNIEFNLCSSKNPKMLSGLGCISETPMYIVLIVFGAIILALPFMVYFTIKTIMRRRYSY